jgi:hypothetical protein
MMTIRRSKKWNVINVVNFQKLCFLNSIAGHYVALFQKLLTHHKKIVISFSHWQCPSDGEFFFPRIVGLLIRSLWFKHKSNFTFFYNNNSKTKLVLKHPKSRTWTNPYWSLIWIIASFQGSHCFVGMHCIRLCFSLMFFIHVESVCVIIFVLVG